MDEVSFQTPAKPALDLPGVPHLNVAFGACRCGQTYHYRHPNARDLANTWWADHHGPGHGLKSLFAARLQGAVA